MAAANYIDFTSDTKLNGLVLQTVSSLRSASNTLAQLVAQLGQVNLDGALAEKLALSADDAAMIYALVNSVNGELAAAPFTQQILSRVG